MLALAPVFAAVLDALVLRRPPTWLQGVGIAVTLGGVVWVIAERPDAEAPHSRKERQTGIVLALIAAVMQPLGATAATIGTKLPDGRLYDPMAATFIRVLTGFVLFATLTVAAGRGRRIAAATRNRPAMAVLTFGAICGPVLGVTFFLVSLQHTQTSVTQAILATIPVLLLPVAMLQKHERVTWRAALGACVAVGGVVVLCLA
ncbi:MAG: EamA family transporter [Tepidisphaeraceae bacterium]